MTAGIRICTSCGKDYPATHEYFPVYKNGALCPNRPCRACIANEHRKYNRAYAEKHAPLKAQMARQWQKDNPGAARVRLAVSRAQSRGLPACYTVSQWKDCLSYWHHSCAICGQGESEGLTIALDHWIPLSDNRPNNPGTVPTNILPLCHSRGGVVRACNNTKQARDPLEWLADVLGQSSANAKLEEINSYFLRQGATSSFNLPEVPRKLNAGWVQLPLIAEYEASP